MTLPFTVRTLKYGPDASQEGDLYLPSVLPCPVVCLLHGGFWRMPYGRDELAPVAVDLAGRGFAVWNIEYRRVGAPGGGWPGTLHDVVSAVDYLAVLVSHGIELDLDRVILAGHSAGGQLALWTAARRKPENVPSLVHVHLCAIAALAPISDLAAGHRLSLGRGAVGEFLGGSPEEHPERYAAVSPVELLPLGVKQLFVHGTMDEAVPIDMSRSFVAAARRAGDDVEFVELPDTGHMDFLDPGSKAHAILCAWLGGWIRR